MSSETRWVTATPVQIARANELATKWRKDARHPIVAVGAAVAVLMTVIDNDVPEEHQEACIQAVSDLLRLIRPDQGGA